MYGNSWHTYTTIQVTRNLPGLMQFGPHNIFMFLQIVELFQIAELCEIEINYSVMSIWLVVTFRLPNSAIPNSLIGLTNSATFAYVPNYATTQIGNYLPNMI